MARTTAMGYYYRQTEARGENGRRRYCEKPLGAVNPYERFFNMREPLSIDMLKSGRAFFRLTRFFYSLQPEGPAPRFRQC